MKTQKLAWIWVGIIVYGHAWCGVGGREFVSYVGEFGRMCPQDLERACQLEADGDIAAALLIYLDVLAGLPDDADAILGVARNAYLLGDMELALEFYIRLLVSDRSNPWGYLGRASVMFGYGADARALADIARAVSLDDPPSGFRIDIAAVLNDYGFGTEALGALRPLRDGMFGDPDFDAEWASGLILAGCLEDPDLDIYPGGCPDGLDDFAALCYLARENGLGRPVPHDEIGRLIGDAPELAGRAEAFGLIFPD